MAASQALFGRGELAALDRGDARGLAGRAAAGGGRRRRAGWPLVVDLFAATGLAPSKQRGPAGRGRGRGVPQQRPGRPPRSAAVAAADLLPAGWLVLRRGKRTSPPPASRGTCTGRA